MKTVSKKLLSLLLVVLLLAAAVPFQAFAEGYKLTVKVVDNGSEKGSDTIDVADYVTKSQIDAKVDEIMAAVALEYPDGFTKLSYTSAAGSDYLTEMNNNEGKLPVDVREVIVGIKTNTETSTKDVRVLHLDAGAGTIGTSTAKTQDIEAEKDSNGDYPVGSLPTARLDDKHTFVGWFTQDSAGNEVQVRNGYKIPEGGKTATARYESITKNIIVKGVKTTESLEKAKIISQYNAEVGQSLLTFLNTYTDGTTSVLKAVEASVPDGYRLKTNNGAVLWYNFSGDTLTAQDAVTSVAQTVLVKYEPISYKLIFDANGGTVTPGEKTVTYDAKVGDLPTPSANPGRKDDVFLGWFATIDEKEVEFTADTVYKVAGNTNLTAKWGTEATVLLRIYLDDKTSTPDRIVDITGKVVGKTVTQTEVEKIVKTYYSGTNMKLVGLFTDATWAEYKAGTVTKGDPNITIQETVKTNIHVVVKNATNKPNSNNNSSSSTTATTKPADKDNPKTGDSMLIYTASAVMIVAAAALVVIQVLRKKRTF